MCMLHGVRLLQVDATPTCGLSKSASWKPTARSIARLGVCLIPSTTRREYLRGSGAVFFDMGPPAVLRGAAACRRAAIYASRGWAGAAPRRTARPGSGTRRARPGVPHRRPVPAGPSRSTRTGRCAASAALRSRTAAGTARRRSRPHRPTPTRCSSRRSCCRVRPRTDSTAAWATDRRVPRRRCAPVRRPWVRRCRTAPAARVPGPRAPRPSGWRSR